jgi:predicted GNAT family acetyltransferase
VRFELTRDAERFVAEAIPFLSPRIECNVVVTVLMSVGQGLFTDRSPLFALGREDGRIAFAAFRTPPWLMLLSDLDERHTETFLDLWLAEDPELPGINGLPGVTRALAGAWSRRTGRPARLRMQEAMHTLTEVGEPPRPAAGELRPADPAERSLLIGWGTAFAREAGILDGGAAMVDSRMSRGGMLVWDDGGPVSMLGIQPEVAGVVRIGPVYTPPELRRRGYAGSAVAAASRRALAGGARTCLLFTDLANATSNKIYAEVGYRRAGDWEEYELG